MKRQTRHGYKRYILFICVLLSLFACAVGPDFTAPTQNNVTLNHNPDLFKIEQQPDTYWWKAFNNQEINQLVETYGTNNFSVGIANKTLEASQYALQAGKGVFYPQVTLNTSTAKQNYFLAPIGNLSNQSIYTISTLTATVSYALDLFGMNRRINEGLTAQVATDEALKKGVQLTLIGHMINTALTIAAYQDELKLIDENKNILISIHSLYQQQFDSGLISYDAVNTAQLQINRLNSTRNLLETNLHYAKHLLNALCSLPPDKKTTIHFSIHDISLPPTLPLSISSVWMKQRPDIEAALAQLHLASANVGVARAAQFPNITLSASMGRANTSYSQLLSSNNPIWGISTNLSQSLLSGGTLAANHQRAITLFEQSALNYQQTVINAFKEVSDVMSAINEDRVELNNQTQLLLLQKNSVNLIQANYYSGRVNGIQYLSTLSNVKQTEIDWLNAKVNSLQNTTLWYLALGSTNYPAY
ncbi:efflux transporter outer membrane subunit [Ferrovum sp. PN-J185]|uniref:efflux transporter outer membrane subunit n=1 Tax=Ferrovum sp. PN-J185 TaxID=1356306 RepID=UPI000791EB16|nr:efflux transporter outer membrane subunit [Ferrovum sp. PN-J185]KXW56364.1 antibiotic efflux pump outer membrane protein ArpC precursor [Ferrovum sp. PN-J185]MCC6069088.1 efflux transporter outer membrane subunit [Ferrovum sp. PN-J185]MDE1890932.1 efflux transporter outer membrane subunit [Betaproteobacteria bacterium]MDE2055756.1 efflux transporter outer membrane subunit [Betaproteobacteria bacterium]